MECGHAQFLGITLRHEYKALLDARRGEERLG